MKDCYLQINIERLIHNIEALGSIGRNARGGIDRAFGSKADLDARSWLKQYWEKLSSDIYIDAIANMWVTWAGNAGLLPIVIGSHHDAVPDGGKYDGALGVLLATEIMQRLKEQNIHLRHPLKVVSFTAEEPNPFNVSTLGSKVVSERLREDDLVTYKNRVTGESLEIAIARAGGDIHRAKEAVIGRDQAAAFLECHIEQGKRLERQNRSVAAVSRITGIYREQYTVCGEANHAGTTAMPERKDAFLAAAKLSLVIEEIAKGFFDDQVAATVGYVKVEPNEANIISGKTQLIVDMRTCDTGKKQIFLSKITKAIEDIEKERGVTIRREVLLDQAYMDMNETVIEAVLKGIDAIGEPRQFFVSMAGHDAANMARVTRSGMIFVRSENGKSHCREELTRKEDIQKVGNAMLEAVLALDKELA